ncbi:MAG TPA: MaoC/PaaZ C-terminal domain-containing protein [Acidimicrobiales bacterium]|nr:MaoC/PaaZ C-terminal domain-containing protein [Acidimicrobiales bacterium]
MPLNPHAVGLTSDPFEVRWSAKDCMLYALGVGAGAVDPFFELEFTTENSTGLAQKVLPTFPVVFGPLGMIRKLGTVDWTKVLHAEQGLVVHRPLAPEGRAVCVARITELSAKGSGVTLVRQNEGRDPETGELLFENRVVAFVRGEHLEGVPRAASQPAPTAPDRPADHVVTQATRVDQALLYRLADGPNPLHSDPEFAKLAGFDRPILHGLCTYGFAGRALLHTVCEGNPFRFRSMHARFVKPVFPGDTLTTSIWIDDDGRGAFFRTETAPGQVALDGGRFTLA